MTVALRHGEVVLERLVRLLEAIPELVALEHVILGARLFRVAQLRIDRAADRPDPAFFPLDPDDDRLGVAVRVDAVEHPLRDPSAVGRCLHAWTMPPRARYRRRAPGRPPRLPRRRPRRRDRWT